jgi:asparagine synthase (glutamine-hydrolysing)
VCAIAGILQRRRLIGAAQHAEIAGLLHAMRHRGPDARGTHSPASWVLLGANRLRITDAHNPAADMPLVSTDGQRTIVFNGEIYNQVSLRADLSASAFRTASDTEVVLAAYQRWGQRCLGRLEGMFALAIYDAVTDQVIMACDPTGQKTMYLWEEADSLVFASEIEAIVTDPHRAKSFDHGGLAEYVAQRFIIGSDTHIHQVRKLEPGTWLSWSRARRTAGRFYQVPRGDLGRADEGAICEDIRAAVVNGGRDAFDVEVPNGLLLSGGIDSAAVLASARSAGLRPRTYSIGFSAGEALRRSSTSVFDEFEHSRRLARDFETEHTELVMSASDYHEAVDRWIDSCGEPLASQEAPCLLQLFQRAAADVRVVFCGGGPDELFDGYSYGQRLSGCSLHDLPERYARTFHWAGDTDFARLMPRHPALMRVAEKLRTSLALYADWPLDPCHAVQLLHFHGRLGAYEFRQLDVTSMRYSIEARSPLANGALVRAAFDCASHTKHRDGSEKWIYKRALAQLVPADIAARRKQGFPIPAELWRSESFTERARTLFEPGCQFTACGLIDAAYLKLLWESPDGATRNVFYRLYVAEQILRRQAVALAQPTVEA